MRVQKATNLFSKDVGSALQFVSNERNINEYSTTATFIETFISINVAVEVTKWLNIIT